MERLSVLVNNQVNSSTYGIVRGISFELERCVRSQMGKLKTSLANLYLLFAHARCVSGVSMVDVYSLSWSRTEAAFGQFQVGTGNINWANQDCALYNPMRKVSEMQILILPSRASRKCPARQTCKPGIRIGRSQARTSPDWQLFRIHVRVQITELSGACILLGSS